MPTDTATTPNRALALRGAIGGMIAAAGMAMFAMIASATYQHHGFFTPLFHISTTIGSPDAMMRSMTEAMAGNRFWFTGGAALLGLVIHMITGAMFGVVYMLATRRLRGPLLIAAGMLYGVVAMVVAALIGLPLAAKVFGGGDSISDMPSMVGWATFTLEHLMFGAILGVVAWRSAPATTSSEPHHLAGSATLA